MPFKNKILKKAMILICCFLIAISEANAFLFPMPVIKLTSITSFIGQISDGLKKITNQVLQLQNSISVVTKVGNELKTIKAYAMMVKNSLEYLALSVENLANTIQETVDVAKNSVKGTKESTEEALNVQQDIARQTTEIVNNQAENGNVTNDEIQDSIDEAREEMEIIRDEVNKKVDTLVSLNDEIIEKGKELKNTVEEIVNTPSLVSDEDKEKLQKATSELSEDIENLVNKTNELINNIKENYNDIYDNVIVTALNEYEKSVQDYMAGRISIDELKKAGNCFNQKMSEAKLDDQSQAMQELATMAQKVSEEMNALEEMIKDALGNNKTYSDEEDMNTSALDDNSEIKYSFFYNDIKDTIFLGAIVSNVGEEQEFLMSAELACETSKANIDFVKKIGENPNEFRMCLLQAQAKEEGIYDKNSLYAPYRREGVFNHIYREQAEAVVATYSKYKQEADGWEKQEAVNSPIRELSNGVDNITSEDGGYGHLNALYLETLKFQSKLRRLYAITTTKSVLKYYVDLRDIIIDERENEAVYKSFQSSKGLVDGRVMMPNTLLYNCGLEAKDLTFDYKSENAEANVAELASEAETKVFNCLFKHSAAATRGIIVDEEGNQTKPEGETDEEAIKKEWLENEEMSSHESAFNALASSIVNNYKSSRDYVSVQDLEEGELNIIKFDEDAKKGNTVRDTYAAGANMYVYSTRQLLDIVDSEASSLQYEILRQLRNLDYEYFGKDAEKQGENDE